MAVTVAILDAARLVQRSSVPQHATQYGVGGGLRLTLVSTLRLTVAYVWNVNRKASDSRGAAIVTLDMSPTFGR